MLKTKKDFKKFTETANDAAMQAGFVCPTTDDIKLYPESMCNYPHDGSKYPVEVAGALAVADDSGSIKLTITGEIAKLSDTAKAALFSGGSQTHATVVLICLPDNNITGMTYKRDSNAARALATDDVVEIDGISYFVLVVGLYDNSGTVTCATSQFVLSNGVKSNTYKLTVSGATLEA